MTDPFIPHGMAGVHQELQRLRNENRQLRLELTKLKIQKHGLCRKCQGDAVPTASTPTAGATGGRGGVKAAPEKHRDENSNRSSRRSEHAVGDGESVVSSAASRAVLLRTQNELQHANTARAAAGAQVRKLRAELKSVSAHFELFINEVAEREEAYRVVHRGIYDELEESRGQSEALRQRVVEREERIAQLERRSAASAGHLSSHATRLLDGAEDKQCTPTAAAESTARRGKSRTAFPCGQLRSQSATRPCAHAARDATHTLTGQSASAKSSETNTAEAADVRAAHRSVRQVHTREGAAAATLSGLSKEEQGGGGGGGVDAVADVNSATAHETAVVVRRRSRAAPAASAEATAASASVFVSAAASAAGVSNLHDRSRLNVFDIPPPRTVTGEVPTTTLRIPKGAGALCSGNTTRGGAARAAALVKRRRRDERDGEAGGEGRGACEVKQELPTHSTSVSHPAALQSATHYSTTADTTITGKAATHPYNNGVNSIINNISDSNSIRSSDDSKNITHDVMDAVSHLSSNTRVAQRTDMTGGLTSVSLPSKDAAATQAHTRKVGQKSAPAESRRRSSSLCPLLDDDDDSGSSSVCSASRPPLRRAMAGSRRRAGGGAGGRRTAASSVSSDNGYPSHPLSTSSLFARFQSTRPAASATTQGELQHDSAPLPSFSSPHTAVAHPSAVRAHSVHPDSPAWPADWNSHIHFGADPIADFLALADSTHASAHRERLRRELMRHCRTAARVAAYAAHYFVHTVRVHHLAHGADASSAAARAQTAAACAAPCDTTLSTPAEPAVASSLPAAPTPISPMTLWQRVRHLLDIDQPAMYPALCASLARQLVRLVQTNRHTSHHPSPYVSVSAAPPRDDRRAGEEDDLSIQSSIRTVALALRATWLHGAAGQLTAHHQTAHRRARELGAGVDRVRQTIARTVVEVAVGALRGRRCRAPPGDAACAGEETPCEPCDRRPSVSCSARPPPPRRCAAAVTATARAGGDVSLGQRWMTAMRGLCGFDAAVDALIRYVNLTAAAQACLLTRRSLSHLALQGIFGELLRPTSTAAEATSRDDEEEEEGQRRSCCLGECVGSEDGHARCSVAVECDTQPGACSYNTATNNNHVNNDGSGSAVIARANTNSDTDSMNSEGDSDGRHAVWCDFCDALQWSRHAIPLDAVGQSAVRILTGDGAVGTQTFCPGPDRLDALLTLRLLVLYRGFAYVHELRAQLAPLQRTAAVDADTIFAQLCSFAVLDLDVCDVREGPWRQTVAFLDDYLHAGGDEGPSRISLATRAASARYDDDSDGDRSTKSLSRREDGKSNGQGGSSGAVSTAAAVASPTRILVLRALAQLCHDTRSEESVAYLIRAMRWMRRAVRTPTPTGEVASLRTAALYGALRSAPTGARISLLRSTRVGQQLLRLLE